MISASGACGNGACPEPGGRFPPLGKKSRAHSHAALAVFTWDFIFCSSESAAPKSVVGPTAHVSFASEGKVSYRISRAKRADSCAASIAATGAPFAAPRSVAWLSSAASAAARAPAIRRPMSGPFPAPPSIVPSSSVTALAPWVASSAAKASKAATPGSP